jgi:tetratricopeptide (TPR) repeat protein
MRCSANLRAAAVSYIRSGARCPRERTGITVARLVLHLALVLGIRCGVAQDLAQQTFPSAVCIKLNRTVTTQLKNGAWQEAESALSAFLASGANLPSQTCAGMILNNMSNLMAASGWPAEAEAMAERSVKILEKIYPPDDPILLHPLQNLTASRYEQRKIAGARESFKRMCTVRIQGPEDRALVAGMAGSILEAEGRLKEAESEYLSALNAFDDAGRGDSAETTAVLNMLGSLYIEEGRFDVARRTLDRALAILDTASDAIPKDRIVLLNVRAAMHARQREWREAEQDLHDAVSAADREMGWDPGSLAGMMANYAWVLRKNHKGHEARSIEARAATLHNGDARSSVVDVSELLTKR